MIFRESMRRANATAPWHVAASVCRCLPEASCAMGVIAGVVLLAGLGTSAFAQAPEGVAVSLPGHVTHVGLSLTMTSGVI
jgi:hypothetical protein